MHVALNAQLLSFAETYRSGGISRVIYHLLAELGRDSRGHTFDVYVRLAPTVNGSARLNFHPSGSRTISPPVRIAWEQTVLPRKLAGLKPKPDLLHGLAYALPVGWPGPGVVTIYDLSFLRFPGAFNLTNRIYLTATTRATARRARRILTISEHARRDIVRLLSVPEQRVDVTYPAADERYRLLPSSEVDAFRVARGLPESFVFALGTLEPRKNLVGLLHAYARLRAPRVPLYVAGGSGWRFRPLFATVRTQGLHDSRPLPG